MSGPKGNHGNAGYFTLMTCEHCGDKKELFRILCRCNMRNKPGKIFRYSFCFNCGKKTKYTGIDEHKDILGKKTPGPGGMVKYGLR